ncbi:hypothetical protein Tco_1545335, partial [Tanacetum coccineum]
IFLLKTSILEWAVDKNGRLRIKGTSLSSGTVSENRFLCCVPDTAYGSYLIRRILDKSALVVEIDLTWSRGFVFVELGRLPNPLSCKTLLIYPICISKVLIEAPWFLIAASVEARIFLIMFEFSSCLLADSAINLVSDSSRLGLQSGYEEFPLFCWYNPGHAALTVLQVDRVHRTVYSRLLPKFSLLHFVDNLSYSVVPLHSSHPI